MRLQDQPPGGASVTEYDREHLVTYLRLLDADAEGADPLEVAHVVLALDPDPDPDRALRIHAAHLERARWMARTGWRDLRGG